MHISCSSMQNKIEIIIRRIAIHDEDVYKRQLYLQIFGRENWYILTLLWVSLPLTAFVLFLCSEIPPLETTRCV